MSKKVRLGIIGLGQQGGAYAKFIADGMVPNMEIGAICDIDPAKKELAAATYPDAPFYDDYIAMLESGDVDAVVTCVPHFLHPEMGIETLKRNIHALVEKPAGVYTKQVKELNEFAASKPSCPSPSCSTSATTRCTGSSRRSSTTARSASIRRTNWIITNWWRPQGYYNSSEWRATWGGEGGGVLVNQAPHQLDLWQWICGVPKSVYSKVAFGFRRDIAVEDEVTAVVDYGRRRHRRLCHRHARPRGNRPLRDPGRPGQDRRRKLQDRHRDPPEEAERELSDGMDMDDVRKLFMGELNPEEYYTTEVIEFESAWGAQHAGVLENFAANILDGTPLLAPGSDGIKGVRLANAIHLSSWTGTEVSLDFDEDVFLAELNKRIADEGKFPERS